MTLREQFFKHVQKDASGCWNWTSTLSNPGRYARIKVDGKDVYAHRVSYELHGKSIPDGMQIDHLCRNTQCVNPEHLEAVTPLENTRRSFLNPRGARKATAVACGREHKWTPGNIVVRRRSGKSQRLCLECKRIWSATYRRKNKKAIAIRRIAKKAA